MVSELQQKGIFTSVALGAFKSANPVWVVGVFTMAQSRNENTQMQEIHTDVLLRILHALASHLWNPTDYINITLTGSECREHQSRNTIRKCTLQRGTVETVEKESHRPRVYGLMRFTFYFDGGSIISK